MGFLARQHACKHAPRADLAALQLADGQGHEVGGHGHGLLPHEHPVARRPVHHLLALLPVVLLLLDWSSTYTHTHTISERACVRADCVYDKALHACLPACLSINLFVANDAQTVDHSISLCSTTQTYTQQRTPTHPPLHTATRS